MPYLFDDDVRTDLIVRGVTHLIATGGMPAVTMRAIASVTSVSQASLAVHLRNRQHLLQVAAHRFGEAMLADIASRVATEGVLAWLPPDDSPLVEDQLAHTRVWLAWCDLGRSNEGVAHAVAGIRDRELDALYRLFPTLDLVPVRALQAHIEGLRAATTALVRPLPVAEARAVLETVAPPARR